MQYSIPYHETQYFSKLILDYLNRDKNLKAFVNYFPVLKNFSKQIIEKNNQQIDRGLLVKVLKDQNSIIALAKSVQKNIDLLDLDTTFTVTTGHQVCIFTGPLYFVYKIISTLNLCEQLAKEYPSNNFVPVFWMAAEDHDINEISHIHLFGKKIKWATHQDGAAGKICLDGFENVISKLESVLGPHKNSDKLFLLLKKAYLNHKNLSDATRYLVNELFGKYGLVIIDGNDKDLKRQFIPQIKKDILQSGFVSAINDCSNLLSQEYKQQAFFRNINFFKLSDGARDLIKEPVNSREIDSHPERFSPNVLLRPLYQEVILPNIAYVGGEAEIAYWMQLKAMFKQEKVPFPILVLRNSALLIDEKKQHKFESLGFKLKDLFLPQDELNRRYLLAHSNVDISLEKHKISLDLLYQEIVRETSDIGLKSSIKAQLQRQFSFLDAIEDKFIRNEKQKNKVSINQIAKIKNLLFPNNMLQERHENFIQFYLEEGDNFIKRLKDNFDPMNPNFVVLTIKSRYDR